MFTKYMDSNQNGAFHGAFHKSCVKSLLVPTESFGVAYPCAPAMWVGRKRVNNLGCRTRNINITASNIYSSVSCLRRSVVLFITSGTDSLDCRN